MAVDRAAGPSKPARRRWFYPAIIAGILFLWDVAGNLVASELDWLRTEALWVVWGVFGVAFLVTILVAIWEHRRPEETESSPDTLGIAPDQQLDFLTSHALIGHQRELQHLCTRHDQMVATRQGQLVFLLAPHGHGRHALADAVGTYARSQGSAVVATDFRRDISLDQAGLKGYAAQVSQRCPRAQQLAGEGWLAVMAQLANVLAFQPAPPAFTDISLDDDPARGLAALLRLVSRRQPLVLVWEYVDHANPLWSTILRYLFPEIRQDLPVLLVMTATAAQPLEALPAERRTPVLELAHAWHEQQVADVLWLDPVTVEEVARYLGPADPRLPRRLHDLTEGIPAVVESLWRQWQEATPPAVVWRNEQWEVAREDNVWVFGEARAQAHALLDVCLAPPVPFERPQVEQMLIYAALEGLTFTAQVIAQVLELEPDDVIDFFDTQLVTHDTRPGLLVDAGFLPLPAVGEQVRHLNRYRFALPYLWHVWVRYDADVQRLTMQRRLADAVESVYAFATDLVSPLLTALFEATGQESRAHPYRHRTRATASLDALRWQIALLESAVEREDSDLWDRYQLFTLRVELSDRLTQEGRWEEGYHHAERAWTMARTWNDEERIALAFTSMGLNLLQGAQLSHAEDVLNQALAIRERVLGPDHLGTAGSCNNLAGVYHTQGRYSEAEPLYQHALAVRERVLGPDHPHTATSCHNLAMVYEDQGRYSEAEPLCQRALAICERVLGPDHPATAGSCHNLAGVYRAQGRYSEAEPLSQRALAIRERVLGPDHPDTAAFCHNLAAVYRAQGRYSEAEPLSQRALAICERVLGPDHPYTATVMENYVDLLRQMHRDAEADNNNIEQGV